MGLTTFDAISGHSMFFGCCLLLHCMGPALLRISFASGRCIKRVAAQNNNDDNMMRKKEGCNLDIPFHMCVGGGCDMGKSRSVHTHTRDKTF